jgi:hypothetical protein
MDEAAFPPDNLAALYTHGGLCAAVASFPAFFRGLVLTARLLSEFEGLPTRELRRFELVDAEGQYVQLGDKKGAVSLVADLAPTTAGKKENAGQQH